MIEFYDIFIELVLVSKRDCTFNVRSCRVGSHEAATKYAYSLEGIPFIPHSYVHNDR